MIETIPFEVLVDDKSELLKATPGINPEQFPFSMFYMLLCIVVKFDTSGVYINLPN